MSDSNTSAPVEYRTHPRFLLYDVGTDGTVRNNKTGHFLTPQTGRKGYLRVSLYCGPRRRQKFALLHRLVLEAFVGPCPPGLECRHLNGIRSDCRLSNLKWGTKAENYEDMVRHGTFVLQRGELDGNAKLTEVEVLEIRRLYATGGISQAALARRYRVSPTLICMVVRRLRWRHI